MDKDLQDILANSNPGIDNQKLLDYINGKLSDKERYEVEKLMADNDFMNDAVEGLAYLQNKKHLPSYVDQLNSDLHKQLQKKKSRREKRKLKEYPWVYFTIIMILVICVIGYLVIRQYLHAR